VLAVRHKLPKQMEIAGMIHPLLAHLSQRTLLVLVQIPLRLMAVVVEVQLEMVLREVLEVAVEMRLD
jgi:hypothetical protein